MVWSASALVERPVQSMGRCRIIHVGGPHTDWAELVQVHDDRDIFQASPDEPPAIDIHSI